MRVRFVYERRRYATMVKMRHGLAILNSNNSVVYGQKHKVWVLVFLERAEHFETKIEQIWCSLLLSLETPNAAQSVAEHLKNIEVTSKSSDQTACMRMLIWGFVVRTYHSVGNLTSRLNIILFVYWKTRTFS